MRNPYDFLIVGAGLFGCVCAHELVKKGFKVIVIDKRTHKGGNSAVSNYKGYTEHMYGPHIFHTSDKLIWDYVNGFEPLLPYKHKVYAVNGDNRYDFPINLNTIYKVFGEKVNLPTTCETVPQNFEEAAISKVGEKLYNIFYKDYTAKQWGADPKALPAEIFSRVPVRLNFEDSYFNDDYVGLFKSNKIFDMLLMGAKVKLNCAFNFKKHGNIAKNIIYSGMLDELKNFSYGELPYRSLRFERVKFSEGKSQGSAVINFTDKRLFTRATEYGIMYSNPKLHYRWYEYPMPEKDFKGNKTEPFYPMPTKEAAELHLNYAELVKRDFNRKGICVYFGGRLGSYKYINMDTAVKEALKLVEQIMA